jgi:hypothetical protein
MSQMDTSKTESPSRFCASKNFQEWGHGVLLEIACAALYIAVRLPLFDGDGYSYQLYALLPDRFYNVNPQHLLWNAIQIVLVNAAAFIGHPTTVPLQIVGIVIDCIVLYFLYVLLFKCSGSALFALSGELLIAFSPWFWYQGSESSLPISVLRARALLRNVADARRPPTIGIAPRSGWPAACGRHPAPAGRGAAGACRRA